MKPIRPHDNESIPWNRIGDAAPPEYGQDQNYFESRYRIHEMGSEEDLQLTETEYLPNTKVAVHAHEQDEIIYVVAGEMDLGGRVLGAGSSLFVARHTLYSFSAGPSGLRFVNFRARRDDSFMLKEEFLTRRASAREGAG